VFLVFGGLGVEEIEEFRIFDRWGELMYEGLNFQPNDPAHGWDGTLAGNRLNPAVFVYYAKVRFIDGSVKMYKGDVTIVNGR
jgi:hypothetical protein